MFSGPGRVCTPWVSVSGARDSFLTSQGALGGGTVVSLLVPSFPGTKLALGVAVRASWRPEGLSPSSSSRAGKLSAVLLRWWRLARSSQSSRHLIEAWLLPIGPWLQPHYPQCTAFPCPREQSGTLVRRGDDSGESMREGGVHSSIHSLIYSFLPVVH